MRKIDIGMLAFGVFLIQALYAQEMSGKRGEATLDLGGGKVSVEYGRPALKGRDINSMIELGQEWRMGADAATTLTSDVDLKFADKVVKKGKYVLRAKLVEKDKWHLLVQKEDKTVVAEVPLTHHKVSNSEELMTIKLDKASDGGKLMLQWGTLSVSTSFQKS